MIGGTAGSERVQQHQHPGKGAQDTGSQGSASVDVGASLGE